jgi:hypothetical protein
MVAAVTADMNAGMWLPAEHFAVGSTRLWPVVQVNLPQPFRKNKTTGLITLEGSETDGG